jgi:hypothetical protein
MGLRLYMDVHVPAAIAAGLRRRGIDVLTSQEDGTRRAGDDPLLERAQQLGRTFVTQDKDFLRIAAQQQAAGLEFNGLVFAPQDELAIGRYIDDLELIAHCYDPAEVASLVLFLPLA